MQPHEMQHLISKIRYKHGWKIVLGLDFGHRERNRPYIQLDVAAFATMAPDGGEHVAWKSGKRYLSEHMCSQEIVGAVFALIKDAEMHEIHEWFRYRGRSIYNPHLSPDALWMIATTDNMVFRDNAMSMEEPDVAAG